jgi:hypothetical protein
LKEEIDDKIIPEYSEDNVPGYLQNDMDYGQVNYLFNQERTQLQNEMKSSQGMTKNSNTDSPKHDDIKKINIQNS